MVALLLSISTIYFLLAGKSMLHWSKNIPDLILWNEVASEGIQIDGG
jgi:hypothetical protein